ncbi:hypothetical protein CUMW_197180 [Citrus unshiu]|nr:hypothetical protein CUMW_197180 [Citrus unshiu]
MGPRGSGKSKLAIELASHFPVEIINADFRQLHQGPDVLTNNVFLPDPKGFSPFSFCLCVLQCSLRTLGCQFVNYNVVSKSHPLLYQ